MLKLNLYAVAAVIQNFETGNMKLVSFSFLVNSREEAIGKAYMVIREKYPNYITTTISTSLIPDADVTAAYQGCLEKDTAE